MAAENGHTAVVEILVKAGADVNYVSDVGCGEVLTSRRGLIQIHCIHCLASMQGVN